MSAFAVLFTRRPDVVVLESWPVLATAAVVAVCAARRIKVINYVKDIYPEAAIAAGILRTGKISAVLLSIDRWICRRADCNVVISWGAAPVSQCCFAPSERHSRLARPRDHYPDRRRARVARGERFRA
jgi:hypothetical protein